MSQISAEARIAPTGERTVDGPVTLMNRFAVLPERDDAFSPLYRQSRYCASCHEGTVLSVHVYSTYSEWLASPARREGKQCQSCHMAPTGTLAWSA